MDRRLVKALAHPMRVRILSELEMHDTLSPTELADEWGESLGVVAYHFRRLHALGFVELARRTPRRGAIQHHYRVRSTPHSFDADSEQQHAARTAIRNAQLGMLMHDLDGAIAHGAFDSSAAWLTRSRPLLDAEGRRQLAAAMTTWDQRAREVAAESATRLARSGSERRVVLALLLFDEPPETEAPVSISRVRHRRARSLAR